jgi:hypothetical protein
MTDPALIYKTKTSAFLPRDAAIDRRPRAEAAARTRQPLDEAPAPMTSARSSELIAYRNASAGGNRGAFLSDIDILVERAVNVERSHLFNALGEVIGETMAEADNRLRSEVEAKLADEAAKVEALTKIVDELRLTVARMEGAAQGAAAERQRASGIIRP